jgi:biotin transport system substrate-specific component
MHVTLAERLWSGTATNRLHQAALIIGGSLLLAVSAHVTVPFWPVPMTMQTFVVLMIGATYGRNLALATVAAYLVEGAAGLPFFAAGSGLAMLTGPTAGYLFGFLIAAGLVGHLADRGMGRTIASAVPIFLLGDAVIFLCGVGWLASLIGIEKALAAGLTPFLLAEAVKIALACALLPWIWKRKA